MTRSDIFVWQYETLKKAKAEALSAQQAAPGKQPLNPLGQVMDHRLSKHNHSTAS